MLQTKRSRIDRTAGTCICLLLAIGLLLLAMGWKGDARLLVLGAALCGAGTMSMIGCFLRWARKHQIANGWRHALLHAKMEAQLYRALYDANFYVERVVLLQKCAAVPAIKIYLAPDLQEGTIRIGNSIRFDKKLDELPIGSALPGDYVITASYIADNSNDYVYRFESFRLDQLRFDNVADFLDHNARIGEYQLFLDARHKVTMFHALIIGQTGSGKSYCLYNLILQMLAKENPYELYIADPKYSGLYVPGSRINPGQVASSVDEILQLLKAFDKRMQERKQEFLGKISTDIDNDYTAFHLRPICLILDEYSSFRSSLARYDKKSRDFADEVIGNIIREGRQLGCFCILTQQQSNAGNLPTELKENMPFKLLLGNSERQTYITALGVYPDVAKRHFDKGQGLLVYPQIANPETPAVTSVPTLNFNILAAAEEICKIHDGEGAGAGVM